MLPWLITQILIQPLYSHVVDKAIIHYACYALTSIGLRAGVDGLLFFVSY